MFAGLVGIQSGLVGKNFIHQNAARVALRLIDLKIQHTGLVCLFQTRQAQELHYFVAPAGPNPVKHGQANALVFFHGNG